MKQYMMYVCETCGFESKSREAMVQHEAAHLGLTGEELREYNSLKDHAEFMGMVVRDSRCSYTEKEFDKAVRALAAFEEAHGLRIIKGDTNYEKH